MTRLGSFAKLTTVPLCLLVACGAGVHARVSAAASPGAPQASLASPTPSPTRWHAVIAPPTSPVNWFPGTASDETFVVLGGVRAVVRGDDVRFVSQATLTPLVSMEHDRAHWYAFTQDGIELRSESFDGEFTRVGETRSAVVRSFAGGGVAAAQTADGRVWASTPDGPFHEVIEARNTLIDMDFVDGGLGVLITEPGRVARTTDSGLQYEPLALPPGVVAFHSRAERGSFVVVTSAGAFSLRATGDLVRDASVAGPTAPVLPPEATRLAMNRLTAASPFAAALRAVRTDAQLGNGRHARIIVPARGRPVLSSWLHDPAAATSIEIDGRDCDVFALPDRFVLAYTDDHETRLTLALTDGILPVHVMAQFAMEPGDRPDVEVAGDSSGVVVAQACHRSDRAPRTGATPLCHVTRDAAETVWIPASLTSESLWGHSLIGCSATPPACNLYDLRDVSATPVPVRLDRECATMSAHIVAPGRVTAVARLADGSVWTAAGDPAQTLVTHPTPATTAAVLALDEANALAFDDRGEAPMMLTADAGRTWAPLALPFDGGVTSLQLVEGNTVRWTSRMVSLGDRFAIVSSDAAASEATAPPTPYVAARTLPPEPSDDEASEYASPRVACTLVRDRTPAGTTDEQDDTIERIGPGGWLHMERRGERIVITGFGGTDARGAFRVARGPLWLPDDTEVDEVSVMATTREMTVLLSTDQQFHEPREVIVIGRTGGLHETWVNDALFELAPPLDTPVAPEALVLDEGHAAVLVSLRNRADGSSPRKTGAALVVVDAAGHSRVVERIVTVSSTLVPARLGHRVGVIALDELRPTHARFFPAPDRLDEPMASVSIPEFHRTADRVCSDHERSDMSWFELNIADDDLGGTVDPTGEDAQDSATTLRVNATTGEACIAAMGPAYPLDGFARYFTVQARGGVLVGTTLGRGARTRTRCETSQP